MLLFAVDWGCSTTRAFRRVTVRLFIKKNTLAGIRSFGVISALQMVPRCFSGRSFFFLHPRQKTACYIKGARRLKGRNGECSLATDRRRLPSTLKSLFSSRKKKAREKIKTSSYDNHPPSHRPSAGLESSHTTTFAANRSGDESHLQSGCCCRWLKLNPTSSLQIYIWMSYCVDDDDAASNWAWLMDDHYSC